MGIERAVAHTVLPAANKARLATRLQTSQLPSSTGYLSPGSHGLTTVYLSEASRPRSA